MELNKIEAGMAECKVLVHDGIFHADDVLCVSLIEYFLQPSELVVKRSRDSEEIYSSDKYNFILDIKGADGYDDGYTFKADHHDEPRATYPNGVIKAACGKLFDYFWKSGIVDKRVPKMFFLKDKTKFYDVLHERLFYPVETQDNGQTMSGIQNNKLSFVSAMIPAFNAQTPETMYDAFKYCVKVTYNVISNMIDSAIADVMSEEEVKSRIEDPNRPEHVLLLGKYKPWIPTVTAFNETTTLDQKIWFCVFKDSSHDQWMIQAVSRCNPDKPFENWGPLPKEWAGKGNKKENPTELDDISGIPGGVFCHAGRFLAAWTSEEAAKTAAIKAVEMAKADPENSFID